MCVCVERLHIVRITQLLSETERPSTDHHHWTSNIEHRTWSINVFSFASFIECVIFGFIHSFIRWAIWCVIIAIAADTKRPCTSIKYYCKHPVNKSNVNLKKERETERQKCQKWHEHDILYNRRSAANWHLKRKWTKWICMQSLNEHTEFWKFFMWSGGLKTTTMNRFIWLNV